MEIGSEKLKALAVFELKMGGTLQQHAERLFLTKTIARTKDNTVKKQALTCEEIEVEREDEDAQADTESGDNEKQIYSPLKLPMGWDGKPIPYWLYKLHGLGQVIILLYVNSSVRYVGTTVIGAIGLMSGILRNGTIGMEAKELWKKIQESQGLNIWRPDLEEEYEDRKDNIYKKKTYTDLQRQGLIRKLFTEA